MLSRETYRLLFMSFLPFFFLLAMTQSARALELRNPEYRELVLGYGYGADLKGKGEYRYARAGIDYSYSFSRWKNIMFQLEPFVSLVESPDVNCEAGCVFFIKYTVNLPCPLKPYVRGGSGILYITQATAEQSTQFNFASQIAYGISYRRNNVELSCEYRNVHISNAGIREPNSGIDSCMWAVCIGF